MNGVRRVLLPLACALALLLATPTAYAGTWRHDDAPGDTLVTDRYEDNTVIGPRRDAGEKQGDITRVTARYGADVLQVAVSARSTGGLDVTQRFRVVTSHGYTYDAVRHDYFGADIRITRNGYRYTCSGLHVGHTRAGWVMRLPTSCLDSAHRVRVGVQTHVWSTQYPDIPGNPGVYERGVGDDAYRTARYADRTPRLGPWVALG